MGPVDRPEIPSDGVPNTFARQCGKCASRSPTRRFPLPRRLPAQGLLGYHLRRVEIKLRMSCLSVRSGLRLSTSSYQCAAST